MCKKIRNNLSQDFISRMNGLDTVKVKCIIQMFLSESNQSIVAFNNAGDIHIPTIIAICVQDTKIASVLYWGQSRHVISLPVVRIKS